MKWLKRMRKKLFLCLSSQGKCFCTYICMHLYVFPGQVFVRIYIYMCVFVCTYGCIYMLLLSINYRKFQYMINEMRRKLCRHLSSGGSVYVCAHIWICIYVCTYVYVVVYTWTLLITSFTSNIYIHLYKNIHLCKFIHPYRYSHLIDMYIYTDPSPCLSFLALQKCLFLTPKPFQRLCRFLAVKMSLHQCRYEYIIIVVVIISIITVIINFNNSYFFIFFNSTQENMYIRTDSEQISKTV